MSLAYQPLPSGNHFRLLDLLPGCSNDAVACQLHLTQALNRNPLPGAIAGTSFKRYEALSYVWGSPTRTHRITVNGWSVTVRENLWLFLVQKRHATRTATLWIDALCINQTDMKERAAQVQLMGSIYRAAERTIVWLGLARHNSDYVMDCLRRERSAWIEEDEFVDALRDWIGRDYWQRTWIVQEFILAKDVALVCGSKQVEWARIDRFCRELDGLATKSDRHDWRLFEGSRPYDLFRQRTKRHDDRLSLLQLLIRNQTTDCLDVRDKVYAMLSLAADYTPNNILEVNYFKPTKALYSDLLYFIRPPPVEVFRVGSFLKRLLRLEDSQPSPRPKSSTISRVILSSPSEANYIPAVGFRTGKIVDCYAISSASIESKIPKLSIFPETEFHAGTLYLPSFNLEKVTQHELESSLACLEALDVRRLTTQPSLLEGVSHRSLFESRLESTPPSLQSSRFSIIVVYFSAYRLKKIMFGLAFGNVRNGDAVIQFPGCDTGITTSAAEAESRLPQSLTGRFLCVNPDGHWTDLPTQQNFSYWGIQSETHLSDSADSLNLLLTAEELFDLL